MQRTFKYLGYSVLVLSVIVSLYLLNLFSKKPYSLDHFLAKELIVGILDSPESMTYLGLFDDYNLIFNHNQRLTISSLEDGKKKYLEDLQRLDTLKKYQVDGLSKNQQITHKIAVFDTEIDIERFERFRYYSYPFNQISGNHLNLVEFMTDTHPVRNENEAKDYIERVKMFDDSLKANLVWLEEQKKLGIFAPKFVFDHVIRQLEEMIEYGDSENPLVQVFSKKISDIGVSEEKRNELLIELRRTIDLEVRPGFELILGYMQDNYENANEYHGVWSLPDGDDFYALRLKSYTTTDYSAEEIHQIGLAEVARIENRMRDIFIELGYEVNKPIGEMMNDLNEDPNFLYADTPDRKEIVIRDYNKMVKEAEEDVRPYFNEFPKSPVEVRAVPEYLSLIHI